MISFRLAEEKDLVNILATYNASIPDRMATADLELQSMEERMLWFKKHQNPNRPAWVILENSKYVGWLSFSNFYGRPAYSATSELSVYLNKEQQGKGLGKEAINFALGEAPQLGIKTVLAFIFSHNAPSLKLFHTMGFQLYGQLPEVANLDGKQRGLTIMGRKL
jgi:L-amino acid N-acyltransferase YncA